MSVESRKAEFLRRKDTGADLMEEVREYIGMSPEQRDRDIQIVCQLATQRLSEKPEAERKRILEWVDPPPESTWRHWRRLMAGYRRV